MYAFLILVLGSYAPAVFDVWLLCAWRGSQRQQQQFGRGGIAGTLLQYTDDPSVSFIEFAFLMFLMLMFLYALVGCLSVCHIKEHYVYKCCVYWHVAQAFP